MTKNTKGYILGAVAAVSYGTNPLFAVPLYEMGMDVSSVLFYRYIFATMILGVIMWMRGDSFRLERRDLPLMVILGIFFAMSSVLLFEAYNYMDVGLASTLLFVEPVFIALILWFFYREKISLWTIISIAICLAGVVFLCNPGEGAHVTATGVTLVVFSALSYGLYMVLINKSRIRRLSGSTLTFYSLLFGMIVFAARTDFFTAVQPVPSGWLPWGCIIGISVVPTIISLMTVAISIQCIGSVPVAILGALEPITGIMFGVLLFGEVLTVRAIIGIFLIICAVMTLVLTKGKS
ncbi:EamA family transporter [uncultured Duncaniella sp.]|uniref:DMT family transporter n=1 Tax=uncultured Duncaniella sp. TaxID=2768039 RepID=UPI0025CEC629|nr:EamA family transporter [uncultured Duncaniella sp.]